MPELPNIVRERLKVSRPTSAHPDPDVLTAFAERALPESERAVVMEHLARCHDCRDILALALPATVTVETAHVPLPVRTGWLRAPVLRWGVVAAGLAVLVVTGILQYPRHHIQTYADLRQEKAPAANAKTAQRAAEFAKPMPGTPSAPASSANGVAANASRASAAPNAIPAGVASTNEQVTASGPANEAARSATSALKSPQLTAALPPSAALGGSFGNSPLAARAKQNSQLSRQQISSSTDAVETQSQVVAANRPDQAPSQPFQYEAKSQKENQVHGAAANQRSFMDVTVDKAKAPLPAPTQQATLLAPRWAISPTGGLLRSVDQGRTWASVDVKAPFAGASQMVMAGTQSQKYQQSAPDTKQLEVQSQAESKTLSKTRAVSAAAPAVSVPIFRAISAAGLEVWAGGSAGELYHSVDGGQQWTRVVLSASGVLLTSDIISIAFPDSQHGQITTSTQEFWFTIDGGQTWQKR
jgi:hypothetical protein